MSLRILPHKKNQGQALATASEWPFLSLRREMDRVFDSFFRDYDLPLAKNWEGEFSPATDVVENGKEIKITAELPGLQEKDIEVSVSEDSITIKGEKKEEKEEKGEDRYLIERSYGSFYRNIALPSTVNIEKVEAKFKSGILEIHLPKKEEAKKKEKKVEIKSAA